VLVIDHIGDPKPTWNMVVEHPYPQDIARRSARRTVVDPSEHLRCESLLVVNAQTLEVRLSGGAYEDLPGHAERRPRRSRWARNSSLSVNPGREPSAACCRSSSTIATTASGPPSFATHCSKLRSSCTATDGTSGTFATRGAGDVQAAVLLALMEKDPGRAEATAAAIVEFMVGRRPSTATRAGWAPGRPSGPPHGRAAVVRRHRRHEPARPPDKRATRPLAGPGAG